VEDWLKQYKQWKLDRDIELGKSALDRDTQSRQEREIILNTLHGIGATVLFENGYVFRGIYCNHDFCLLNQSTRIIVTSYLSSAISMTNGIEYDLSTMKYEDPDLYKQICKQINFKDEIFEGNLPGTIHSAFKTLSK
jgi:hypothetical protein